MSQEKKVSVMIAFICDPYLAILQKRLYDRFWKNEIDELVINVNGRNDLVRKFIVDLWKDDDKVKRIDKIDREIRQGLAFNRIYPFTTSDILMTLDSDNFIYKSGVITFLKNVMTKHDAVGSFGFHAYPESVANRIVEKYGTVRLNPFMSCWKKAILNTFKRVDFCTYNFKRGDIFEPIGEMLEDGWLDIMGKLSLEYFFRTKNFIRIPMCREDEWVHVGGLSSIFRTAFRNLEDTNTQKYIERCNNIYNVYYLASQSLVYELTKDSCPLKDFNKEYEIGLAKELTKSNIAQEEINAKNKEMLKSYRNRFEQ